MSVITTAKPGLDSQVHQEMPLDGIEVIEIDNSQFMTSMRGAQQQRESASAGGIIYKLRTRTGILSSCRMPDVADIWARKVTRYVKDLGSWDLVISSSGPYSVHYIAHKLKRRNQVKRWIADYRDLWTNHEFYRGIVPFRWFERALEQKWLVDAEHITTVSDGLKKSLQQLFPDKQITTIMNGFVKGLSPEYVASARTDNLFRIVYTGTIYDGENDPAAALNALKLLIDDNPSLRETIRLDFFGTFSPTLESLLKQLELTDIVVQNGMVSNQDALQQQISADLLLFFTPRKINNTGIITGKLFEYIQSGTPILATGLRVEDEATRIIKEVNAGFTCSNEIAEIKQALIDSIEGTCEFQLNTRALKQYSRESQAAKLISLINA